MLVVARKGVADINRAPKNSLYLVDPYTYTNQKMYFIMEFESDDVKQKTWIKIRDSDKGSMFLIFADWGPYPHQKHTYASIIDMASQVILLPKQCLPLER